MKFYFKLNNGEVRKVFAASKDEAKEIAFGRFGADKVVGFADFTKPLTRSERKEAAEIFKKLFLEQEAKG